MARLEHCHPATENYPERTTCMVEACHALEEHGYFEVLDAHDPTTKEEREERRAMHEDEKELV